MLRNINGLFKKEDIEKKTFETFSRLSKENSMPEYKYGSRPDDEESTNEEE